MTTPPLVKGQQFSVNFPKKGNYKLVCLVHENMTGVVHVLDSSTPLPFDQQDYNEQAADQRTALLSDADHDGDHDGHHGQNGEHGEHRLGGSLPGTSGSLPPAADRRHSRSCGSITTPSRFASATRWNGPTMTR